MNSYRCMCDNAQQFLERAMTVAPERLKENCSGVQAWRLTKVIRHKCAIAQSMENGRNTKGSVMDGHAVHRLNSCQGKLD